MTRGAYSKAPPPPVHVLAVLDNAPVSCPWAVTGLDTWGLESKCLHVTSGPNAFDVWTKLSRHMRGAIYRRSRDGKWKRMTPAQASVSP